MFYYIAWTAIIFFILFIIFLILLKLKIEKFELKIINQFKAKNNTIASIYEITKKYLNKHDEIFKESLYLKKKDFSENSFYSRLNEKLKTYELIHNELNFIFRVCNKHPKLSKDGEYLYIRDLIIEKSTSLGKDIELYKKIVKKFNRLLILKDLTIIGILIPIKREKII